MTFIFLNYRIHCYKPKKVSIAYLGRSLSALLHPLSLSVGWYLYIIYYFCVWRDSNSDVPVKVGGLQSSGLLAPSCRVERKWRKFVYVCPPLFWHKFVCAERCDAVQYNIAQFSCPWDLFCAPAQRFPFSFGYLVGDNYLFWMECVETSPTNISSPRIR